MAHPSHRSSSTIDSEPLEDFEGAAGVTNLGKQTAQLSQTCDLCHSHYPFASCFAYIYKNAHEFRENANEGLNRAAYVSRGEEWKQRGGGALEYACIKCCEKLHNEKYSHEDGKPTSAWMDAAKKVKVVGADTSSTVRWRRWNK